MRLVKQTAYGECACACLAMVTGDPLDRVVAAEAAAVECGGMTDAEVADHLRRRGYDARIVRDWDGLRPAILAVPSLNHPGVMHAIVWDGSRYLDPSIEELTYPRDATVIRPEAAIIWGEDA